MAEKYKILAQSDPLAVTETDVYTVPAGASTVISTITLANRGAGVITIRLSLAPGGIVTSNEQYLYYNIELSPKNTISLTLGITLATTDVLRVYSNVQSLSVNVFGLEVT